MDLVDLGAENDVRMARLREALRLGQGFQLVIVQVEPGEQREEVLRRLAGWSGEEGVPSLELTRIAAGESSIDRLVAGEHDGVVVVGLEPEGDGKPDRWRAMVASLNWSRDRLPGLVRGPLILVVSQRVQTALFEDAPDFYSWRAHSTSIAPRPIALMKSDALALRYSRDPEELESMIAEASLLYPLPVLELARLQTSLGTGRAVRAQFSQAEAAFDAAHAGYIRAGTTDDVVDLLVTRSRVMEKWRGRFVEAAVWLERAREAARRGDANPRTEARLAVESATLAFERGYFSAATAELPGALAAVRALGENTAEEASLVTLDAMLAWRRGDVDVAVASLGRVRDIYRLNRAPAGEAVALRLLANLAASTGLSYEAEHYGLEAVERAEVSGNPDLVARTRAALATIALANDHVELAGEVLRYSVTVNDPDGVGLLAEARGRLALRRGDVASAEVELQEAIEAYQRRGALAPAIAEVSLELGKLARDAQRWDLALERFERAARGGDARQRAIAALEAAQVAVDRGQMSDALAQQLAAATAMLIEVKETTLADTSRWAQGEVLRALGRDSEARVALETAFSGFHARGQAEPAERIRALLAQF